MTIYDECVCCGKPLRIDYPHLLHLLRDDDEDD